MVAGAPGLIGDDFHTTATYRRGDNGPAGGSKLTAGIALIAEMARIGEIMGLKKKRIKTHIIALILSL